MVWSAANEQPKGYLTSFENLESLRILRAGHMVPMDVPEVALEMMKWFLTSKIAIDNKQIFHPTKIPPSTSQSFRAKSNFSRQVSSLADPQKHLDTTLPRGCACLFSGGFRECAAYLKISFRNSSDLRRAPFDALGVILANDIRTSLRHLIGSRSLNIYATSIDSDRNAIVVRIYGERYEVANATREILLQASLNTFIMRDGFLSKDITTIAFLSSESILSSKDLSHFILNYFVPLIALCACIIGLVVRRPILSFWRRDSSSLLSSRNHRL